MRVRSISVAFGIAISVLVACSSSTSTTSPDTVSDAGAEIADGSAPGADAARETADSKLGDGASCTVSSECSSGCCQIYEDGRGYCQVLVEDSPSFQQQCACAQNSDCLAIRTCGDADISRCEITLDSGAPRYCGKWCG